MQSNADSRNQTHKQRSENNDIFQRPPALEETKCEDYIVKDFQEINEQ